MKCVMCNKTKKNDGVVYVRLPYSWFICKICKLELNDN